MTEDYCSACGHLAAHHADGYRECYAGGAFCECQAFEDYEGTPEPGELLEPDEIGGEA